MKGKTGATVTDEKESTGSKVTDKFEIGDTVVFLKDGDVGRISGFHSVVFLRADFNDGCWAHFYPDGTIDGEAVVRRLTPLEKAML